MKVCACVCPSVCETQGHVEAAQNPSLSGELKKWWFIQGGPLRSL